MYYGSGTGASALGTFLREMTSWPLSWKSNVKSKIRLRQSMRIYVKDKNPAKFHPGPVSLNFKLTGPGWNLA